MSTIDHRPGEPPAAPAAAPVTWAAAPADPGPAAHPAAAAPTRPLGRRRAAIAAGVLALAVAGGGTFAVVHAAGGSSSSASATAGGPGGAPGGAGGAGAGGLGSQPTDHHLSGTITAVGNGTVTIRTSSGGTTTYTVTSSTHLVRSGSTAPLSAFQVGDSVNASTTTQNGTVLDDMVSGTGAGGGAQGGTPPQQGTGAGTAGTGTDDS